MIPTAISSWKLILAMPNPNYNVIADFILTALHHGYGHAPT